MLQVTFCFAQSVATTRFMIQDELQVGPTVACSSVRGVRGACLVPVARTQLGLCVGTVNLEAWPTLGELKVASACACNALWGSGIWRVHTGACGTRVVVFRNPDALVGGGSPDSDCTHNRGMQP